MSSRFLPPPEQGSTASFSEQIVDIPVCSGGPQGFLRRQSSTAPSPQTVDIPSSGGGLCRFSQDRVQQRRLRRSLTFLLLVEAFVVSDIPAGGGPHGFLPTQGGGLQDFFAGQGFTAFLDFNTLMMLLGVHAEVEDLLEVLKAPSQDTELNSPRLSLSSPVRWPTLHPAWTRRLRLRRVQCGGRVRRCGVLLASESLFRGRDTSPKTRP